jgi:hypothetical protein
MPKMKKSKNRAKKRGPIIAAIRKNNLIDSPSSNIVFVKFFCNKT